MLFAVMGSFASDFGSQVNPLIRFYVVMMIA